MLNALRTQFSNIDPSASAVANPAVPVATPVENPVWDRAVEPDVQGAMDRVLQYLRAEKIDLTFSASGNLVDLALRLSNGMGAVITDPTLADDVRAVVAHMVSWMCDYAERTGVDRLSVQLNPADMAGGSAPSLVVADNGFQVPIVSSEKAGDVSKQVADVGRKLTLDLKMNAPGARPGMMGGAIAPGGGGSAASQQTDRDMLVFGGEPITSDQMRPLARRVDLDFLRSHASQLSTVLADAQQLGQLIDRAQGVGIDAASVTAMSPAPMDLSVINGPVLSVFDVASLLPAIAPSTPVSSPSSQSPVWTGGRAAANDLVMAAPIIPLRADLPGAPLRVDAPNMSAVTSAPVASMSAPVASAPVTPVSASLSSAPSEFSKPSAAPASVGAQPVLSTGPDAPTAVTSGAMAQVMAVASVQPQSQSQSTVTMLSVADMPVQPIATGQSSVSPAPSVGVAGPESVGSSAFLTPTSAVNIAAAQTVAMNENRSVASDIAVAVADAPVPAAAAVASPDVSARVEAPAVSVLAPAVDTATVAPTQIGDRSSVVSEIILPRSDARMPDHTERGEIKGYDTPRVEVKNPDSHGPEVKNLEIRNPEFKGPESKEPEFKGPETKGPEVPVFDWKPNIKPENKHEIVPDIHGPNIPAQPPVDRLEPSPPPKPPTHDRGPTGGGGGGWTDYRVEPKNPPGPCRKEFCNCNKTPEQLAADAKMQAAVDELSKTMASESEPENLTQEFGHVCHDDCDHKKPLDAESVVESSDNINIDDFFADIPSASSAQGQKQSNSSPVFSA